ncbi:DUF3367 domain-containing protein [Modestobacter sp. I12A-02628]|uniref:DUF3367 domain-containing protein n=1 Tax=Goekera deserti TaxID=2497753 RepID=A0A7K3WD36_9ACTN|nr:alpha-(1->3)-arabinofuranosyltransferase [Goekera deserti]MPQ97017.1 DUF3367 domain-containing protein [Goekera deserti]NDI46667.1 DUF3367 domain-containing protein [Goekera deserti]NEL54236.1 DUF3367 domain-containing protein [Goekera deserti]
MAAPTLLEQSDAAPARTPGGGGAVPVPPAAGTPPPASRLVHRLRLAAVCLAFTGLALSQNPNRIVADTKLDLAINPLGLLGRALSLWDPEGFAGQVQNQAYGYLFPMGPFFVLGDAIGLPVWVVQRLWLALLLSVAFLGAVTLAERLRIGTPGSRLVAGLVFALAPRMISGLGATSIEVLPMAVAPWVLVPLVTGSRTGSPRRAAALSGVAVFCAGGVNAVAASAVLPLAALWLLTREPGPRRRRLMAWWAASVLLATAWWSGSLLLLGRYSPPFLDYIETADTTTARTELTQTLRGTSQWLAFLSTPDGPVWPAGWELVRNTLPVLATGVLLAVGLFGLTRRHLPHRTWMVLGLLTGLVLVTLGHLSTVEGVLAGPLHTALDGPLSPLRNVHKYDPVLRLPLALAVAHVVGRAWDRGRQGPGTRPARLLLGRAGAALVVLALLSTLSPALEGRLTAPRGFIDLPGYWDQTADWLADRQSSGRALLLPGSTTGQYVWGDTGDEPMQPLAESPWEVRNAIPLTPPGHIRTLDAVEAQLARGTGSAGLGPFLARSGIEYLVVRNDLASGALATRSALVHEALAASPGITRVAGFGPRIESGAVPGRVLDSNLAPRVQAVEVFEVRDAADEVTVTPQSGAVTVLGGPEGVLAAAERGLVTGRPAQLADGTQDTGAPIVVSDALVRRERNFGAINDASSAGLTADDPLRLDAPARDYLIDGQDAQQSVVRLDGGAVSASSSASDPDSLQGSRPDQQPYAALDGDPTTSWQPADRLGDPQPVWWQVDAAEPLRAEGLSLVLADPQLAPTEVRITTSSGQLDAPLLRTDQAQYLPLPVGPTSFVRITALPVEGAGGDPALHLAEVAVPGLTVDRSVVTPAPAGAVDAYVFDSADPARSGCVDEPDRTVRCSTDLVRGAEEPEGVDRVLTVAEPADYDVSVSATPRPGPGLDALLDRAAVASAASSPDRGVAHVVGATASSQAVPDPRGGPWAAVDGDPGTTWSAAALVGSADADAGGSLSLRFDSRRTVDRIRLVLNPAAAAARPVQVEIDDGAGGLLRTVTLDLDGAATFAPLTTDRVTLRFPDPDSLATFDPQTRLSTGLGVGVSEVELPGVVGPDPATVVDLPCGTGPTITVDGRVQQTQLTTTLGDLTSMASLAPVTCTAPATTGELAAGEHRFTAASTASLAVESATLTRIGGDLAAPAPQPLPVEVTRWDAEHRVVSVPERSEPALVVVPENVNPGWQATLDGVPLESRTVDGWQQAYLLPAGSAGELRLDFAPGATYRAALGVGLLALVVLAALALLPARGRRLPPVGPRRVDATVAAAGVLLIALSAGWVGVLAVAVLAAARRWWAPARRLLSGTASGVLAGGLAVAAVAWLAADGASSGETGRQVLAAVGVAVVLVGLFPARGWAWRRPRRRPAAAAASAAGTEPEPA